MYGIQYSVQKSIKALAAELGVTDHVVSYSLKFLIKKSYMVKKSAGGVGRPASRYDCGPRLYDIIGRWPAAQKVFPHEPLIKAVFCADWKFQLREERIDRRGRGVLKLAGRLLLAVLLANADAVGQVRELSFEQLENITGLNSDRLRWQIKLLKSRRFLLGYIPGGTHRKVIGRMSGSFFLDLCWHRSLSIIGLVQHSYQSESIGLPNRLLAMASALNLRMVGAHEIFSNADGAWRRMYGLTGLSIDEVQLIVDLFSRNLTYTSFAEWLTLQACQLVANMVVRNSGDYANGIHLSIDEQLHSLSCELVLSFKATKREQGKFAIFFEKWIAQVYAEVCCALAKPTQIEHISKCVLHPNTEKGEVILCGLHADEVVYA